LGVRWGALLGIAAAVPSLVYLWGFTVDDALIPARYAAHIAHGLGYRFNAHGPSTDGVTPLGWAYVLAPFAKQGPLAALRAARAIGVVAWLGAAAMLGSAVARVGGTRWRYAALLIVLVSPSLGAWASAGLETGIVVALATMAAVLSPRPASAPAGAALAGACAWLRPEMIAYALILGAGRARVAEKGRRSVLSWALAVAPWCVAGATRWLVWGRPAPLAVLSKPSDLAHGLAYVGGGFAFSGALVAAFAPLALRRLTFWPRVLVAAATAHVACVALAGGDWMPLERLICPVVPALVLVVAHLLAEPAYTFAQRVVPRSRLLLGCAGEIVLFVLKGPSAAHVMQDRSALIDAARPALAGATRVATIDVGWVGAASEADIVDLAGATDPEIASLPGGHTSKMISGAFLTGRDPDRLVFEVTHEPEAAAPVPVFERAVEVRLAADPLVHRRYSIVWRSPVTLPIRYVILSRRGSVSPTSDPPAED
jgi:hypothetical protein